MVQHKLHRYFRSQRSRGVTPRITFLHLPQDLRYRIYRYIGLVSSQPIYLNYVCESDDVHPEEYIDHDPSTWPIDETITARSQSLSHFLDGPFPPPGIFLNRYCACGDSGDTCRYDCTCDALPYQLLYVSEKIAGEVSAMFYSENHFSVYRRGLGHLSGLQRLSTKAITQLRSLSICLNIHDDRDTLRYFGPDRWDNLIYYRRSWSLDSIKKSPKKPESRFELHQLKEWQQICCLLGDNIQSRHLKLSITYDTIDYEEAEKITLPLLTLPPLQDCSLRLGMMSSGIRGSRLQQLARSIVDRLSPKSTLQSFRYTDLPREVRHRILEFTDLVSVHDLVWAPNTDMGIFIGSPFLEHRLRHLPYGFYKPYCCGDCSSPSPVCSCWFRHAAFSSSCTCWSFPISVFLTCHQMKLDAEYIFYSRNHFIINPFRKNSYPPFQNLDIYAFLTSISKDARKYLRSLTWTLPNIRDGYLSPGSPTHREWLSVLKILSQEINPSALILTLDLTLEYNRFGYEDDFDPQWGDQVSFETFKKVRMSETWSVGQMLANSLRQIGTFKIVWFHINWPWDRHIEGGVTSSETGDVLERLAMGDNYDSTLSGKFDQRHKWNGYDCGYDCETCQSDY